MSKNSLVCFLLFSICFTSTAFAATKEKTSVVDCSRTSLAAEINKLDKTSFNVLEFSGDCIEDITVQGHKNLTLRGVGVASITATAFDPNDAFASTTALSVSRSEITIESATINGGYLGVECTDRSVCVLRDVNILRGFEALAVQSQSAADVYGNISIVGAGGFAGIGVYGASAVNIKPNWANGYDPTEAGPTVSGFGNGVVVQDGSFFRSDNAEISGNSGRGMLVRRGAIVKVFGDSTLPGVTNNGWRGIEVTDNSAAQIVTPISGNGGEAFVLGVLSSARVAAIEIEGDIVCTDDTSRSDACPVGE